MAAVFIPLYPEFGGPPRAYLCLECQEVTRTKRGMILHLIRTHKIHIQTSLNLEVGKEGKSLRDLVKQSFDELD